uniref:reticulophagy regulator 3-like isoform X2 n=1 Tax=Styela clava TaxID=7725 RepID=UPI00193941ED|nr:reticulophagy regulator 3-like isoform X2 [Styela clava]
MLRFRGAGDPGGPSNIVGDAEESNRNNEIRDLKEKLMNDLRSYETVIHYFQQLLVWEKPVHSVVFVLALHAVFWYLKIWSTHAVGLISTIILILVWLDMWKHRIWPEIRARDPDPEADEWGELHPHLLTFPEVCLALAEIFVTLKYHLITIRDVRRNTPGKFVTLSTVTCLMIIFLGRSIPGTLLAYIIMMCGLLWPLIWYRRWVERAYAHMEPFLMQLQYSLKPRMRRNGKKGSHITKEIDGTSVEVHTDTSSDDDDISEFMKPLDAVTAEVLARALTDDDELSESDESLLAHELPSFSHPALDSNKVFLTGSRDIPEVPLPSNLPRYDDPQFRKEILNESDDETLGFVGSQQQQQQLPDLARQIAVSATADAMKTAMKNIMSGATSHTSEPTEKTSSTNSRGSTPSDDGFVILDKDN